MRDTDGKEPAPPLVDPTFGQAPSTSAVTSLATPAAPPSPGIAPGAQRLPGEPTVPAWDPATLALAMGQLANQLFAGPSVVAGDQHASPQSTPQQPAMGGGLPPATQAEPVSGAFPPASPPQSPAAGAFPQSSPQSPASGGFPYSPPLQSVAGGAFPYSSSSPSPTGGAFPRSTQPLGGSSSSSHEPSASGGYPQATQQQRGGDRPHATTTAPHSAPAGLATGATRSASPASREGSGSPFGATPNFDALVNPVAPAWNDDAQVDAYRVPLVENEANAKPADASPSYQDASPSYRIDSTPYQIDPTPEHDVRSANGGSFDPYAIRREFPILEERPHGKRLVWLDNAATTQKPLSVIERIATFYRRENSNVHRAAHTLAARATDAYEKARDTVRRFLNAPSTREIVFVRGATEGINLVAQSWGRRNVEAGDEIVITWLEHHANIVPWQMLCAEKGARLRVAPVDDRGQVILEEYEKLLNRKTRIVAIPQVSNALGTVTPTREMVRMARRHGACVLVDGAQAVSHMRVDVQQLDCDFYVFSGHKVFAPTGIGVVYGRSQLYDTMPPWQGGGNMIEDVTFEKTRYQPAPARFEAGTGNIADAVGLGAALDWLTRVGLENVERHEHDLLVYGTQQLQTVPGLTIIGTAPDKAGVLSFVLAGRDTQQVATALDQDGIAVRGGHHCAQPILRRFGLESTVRASLAPYNVCEDIDALVAALHRIQADQPPRP